MKKRLISIVSLLLLFGLFVPAIAAQGFTSDSPRLDVPAGPAMVQQPDGPTAHGVLGGIVPQPAAPQAAARPLLQPLGTTLINFDEAPATCMFVSTTALRDRYAALGVLFSAPENDGGAILDECGGWGVTGFSAPNVLAFNTEVQYNNGGVPRTPETITFNPAVDFVQISVGSDEGPYTTMQAFDAGGNSLGSTALNAPMNLQPMSISAPGIVRVVITAYGRYVVLDDLIFGIPTAVKLASFAAEPQGPATRVTWATASGIENVGFNLYRSTTATFVGEQLNKEIIPSVCPGCEQGASYEFLDRTAQPGVTYYYTLEDVDASGQRTAHGPISFTRWQDWLPVVGKE